MIKQPTLTEIAQKRAREELGETPDLVRSGPDALRASLRSTAEESKMADVRDDLLRAANRDDMWLLRFLRARKFSVEDATANAVAYFRWIEVQVGLPDDFLGHDKHSEEEKIETKRRHLEFWTLRCRDVQDILNSGVVAVLPGYDANGAKMLFVGNMDRLESMLRKHQMKVIVLAFQYLLDQLSLDPNVQVCGLGVVEDLSGFRSRMYMDLMKRKDVRDLQKKKAKAMNGAYPFRFADMWIVDAPWYFRFIWAIFHLLLKKKIRDRVHLVQRGDGGLDRMHGMLGREQLPVSLGGTLTEEQILAATKEWVDRRLHVEQDGVSAIAQ